MLAGLLALLSAATFAFNNASLRRGVLTGSVAQAMAITVPLGVPLFLLATLVSGTLWLVADFSFTSVLIISSSGVVHFLWGRYCNYRATAAIGTNLTAPIQQFNLLVSLGLAILVLDEKLTPLRMLGIALVLLGPYFAMRSGKKPKAEGAAESKPPTFQPRYAEGIIFSLLTATGYGASPILIRLGLEGKGIAHSLPAGLIAYIAATGVLLFFLILPGSIEHLRRMKWESAKWFTLSGFLVCISQMFWFMAVSLAPVTVVSPIGRLSVLFRLYFSRLLNPHHEVWGGQIILGTVVSLLGALALSLSIDVVGGLLPEAWQPFLHWEWP